MQYGCTLDRLLREIFFADPYLGPVYILKADVSGSFYSIDVHPKDAPNLGLIFPSGANEEPMVAIPITLPMVWKNSLTLFCTAAETVADLANEALRSHQPSKPHKLEQQAEAVA